MTEHPSDAEVMVASRSSPDQFALIFDRHYTAIQGYLRRRLGRSDADDLAAETFIVAFRRRADYDVGRAGAKPWLFGIAVNLLRRHRRQERRELRAYARTAVDPVLSGSPEPDPRLSSGIEPQLARGLATLSGDREVLFLYACAELSYEEIAAALGIPIGTVRSRLFRARRQLRELLAGEGASTNADSNEEMIQPGSAR